MGFESGFNASNKPEAGESASEKLQEACTQQFETILSELDSEFGGLEVDKALLRLTVDPAERLHLELLPPVSNALIKELDRLEERFDRGKINDALISINYRRNR